MLVRCEDFGPLTRIFGAFSLVAHDVDVPVVLMDDDIAYRRSALDAALTCFCKHPGEVCAFAGYDRLDRQGNRYKSIRQFATFITSLQTLRRLEWAEMRFRCDAIVDIPMQFRCDIAWVRLAPMRLDSDAISTWRCDATHPCHSEKGNHLEKGKFHIQCLLNPGQCQLFKLEIVITRACD